MATINFLYRSTKSKSNLVLRLLYRYNDADFVFGAKTKFEIEKSYWIANHVVNKKTKKIPGTKDTDILNRRLEVTNQLNRIENHVLKAFNLVNPDEINKEWLQRQIDYYYNPPQQDNNIPINLIDYIDFYIEYRKNEIKETSKRKFNVIKHKLQRFEEYRKKTILIKDINDSFKNEFVNYLKEELYSQNTMQRELVFIKTFCKHARFLGLETHPQLDSLRLDRAKVEKIYLSFDELEQIEQIDITKLTDSLDNAKDWLIISCYTGQRVSDFMRFSDEQIRVEDGKHLIEFTQKKTGKNMTVPLHPKVLEILRKRNGKFPYPISDQKYNDYIKDVCREAKIIQKVKGSKMKETKPKSGIFRKCSGTFEKCELVSSHIGRRSFATNFYGKIPTTYLIYVTGHATESMFLNYIGKSNKDLAMELTNYF
jgi:integrase